MNRPSATPLLVGAVSVVLAVALGPTLGVAVVGPAVMVVAGALGWIFMEVTDGRSR